MGTPGKAIEFQLPFEGSAGVSPDPPLLFLCKVTPWSTLQVMMPAPTSGGMGLTCFIDLY